MLIPMQFLCAATANAALLIFLFHLLPNRLNIWKIVAISLGYALYVIPRHLFIDNEAAFRLIHIITYVSLFLIPVFCFQGILLRKTAVFALFLFLMFLSETVSATIIMMQDGTINTFLTDGMMMLIHNALAASIYMILGSLTVFIWRIIVTRKVQPLFLLFFILPIGQMITVYGFMFSIWTAPWVIGVLLSFVADLVLLTCTIAQEKKTELEETLRETRHRMELEQFHYREVEQRREELNKIRRDFSRQLVSVDQLVRSGETRPAQQLIRSLSEEINKTKENPYCAIPVVNAILTEKAWECEAAGIGLDVELDIPARLTVEQMHLCSIFSNLLDNAIDACKQAEVEHPGIHLSSKVDGDYLFIKVVNPSAQPPKKTLPGRGYGTRILSDLTERYGGNYQSGYRDGIFTAVSSLLALDR